MGSYDFTTYAAGEKASLAFLHATEQAAWEHGHGGYTGTIAEKMDFVIIQAAPLTKEQARELAEKLIEADDPRISDKWGPAGALPVCDEPDGKIVGWLFFGWASS